jgi:hypothetical protein
MFSIVLQISWADIRYWENLKNSVVNFMDQCGICRLSDFFWGSCGSQLKIVKYILLHYAYFGLLGCLFPGESSTQTLFLRVMDTFDDDDDDNVSLPVHAHNEEHLGL